LEHGFIWC